MAATLIIAQAVDFDGNVLSGALLSVYEAGTTTPRAIYKTSDLSGGASATNPAVATSSGAIAVWVDDSAGDIKVILTNAAGTVTYYTQDNIDPTQGNILIYPLGGSDQATGTGDSVQFATLTLTGDLDMSGNDIILDADNDTKIVVNGDDSVSVQVGGVEVLKLDGAASDKLILDGVSFSPTSATVGQALGYPNSTTTLEPYTPAGGGDTLKAANETITGDWNFNGALLLGGATVYAVGGADVSVSDGGTGASTAADARTNLGLAIGTDVQAFDAGLQSISGLTTAADRGIYTTASDTYATFVLTSAGRALLDDADASAQRATLGLGSGDSVTFSAVTTPSVNASGDLVVGAGGTERITVSSSTGTTFVGRNLTGQFPTGLYVVETDHPTSRRAGMSLGANWQLLQDTSGNGTADFGLFNGAIANIILGIDTQERMTFGVGGPVSSNMPTQSLTVKGVVQDGVGPVNVKAFGATGDGTTDDATAINAAVTAALANRRAVYFPAGTYRLTSKIDITSGGDIKLFGDGPTSSMLFFDGAVDGIDYETTNQFSDSIHIRDLAVLTNQDNAQTGISIVFPRNVGSTWRNATIENVILSGYTSVGLYTSIGNDPSDGGWGTGVFMENCSDSYLSYVTCRRGGFDRTGTAFHFNGYCVDTIAFKCQAFLYGLGFLKNGPGEGLQIIDCMAVNSSSGIDLNPNSDASAKSVTSLTQTGGVATATVTAHGFETGDWVQVAGADQSGYNETHKITVTGANTFTFPVDGGTVSPATGTITAIRNAGVWATVRNFHLGWKTFGIRAKNIDQVNISDCLLYNAAATGVSGFDIDLQEGANRAIISNNQIYVDETLEGNGTGIRVASDDVSIIGNRIEERGQAINIVSGATRVFVSADNKMRSNGDNILDNGTSTDIQPTEFSATHTFTLTGGSAEEVFSYSLPAGMFASKPDAAFFQVTTDNDIGAVYDYDNASNSASTIYFRVFMRDGTNLPSGAKRTSIHVTHRNV